MSLNRDQQMSKFPFAHIDQYKIKTDVIIPILVILSIQKKTHKLSKPVFHSKVLKFMKISGIVRVSIVLVLSREI